MLERARPMTGKNFRAAINAGQKVAICAGWWPVFVLLSQRSIVLFHSSSVLFQASSVWPQTAL
jgi:hypothetical protein